jgi:hypothetical protein
MLLEEDAECVSDAIDRVMSMGHRPARGAAS